MNQHFRVKIESSGAGQRWLVLISLLCSYAWLWLGPDLLELRGMSDTAAWAGLWFIPTTIALSSTALIGLLIPNRFTLSLFAMTLVPHLAVGLGVFPK